MYSQVFHPNIILYLKIIFVCVSHHLVTNVTVTTEMSKVIIRDWDCSLVRDRSCSGQSMCVTKVCDTVEEECLTFLDVT